MARSEALYIEYGTTRIPFLLVFTNRKTLSISVTPDRQVTITAPQGAGLEKIFEKVAKRAAWISRQVRKFESYEEVLLPRDFEYVSGETCYYLGRKYRLKVLEGLPEQVSLQGKYIKVTVKKKADEQRIAGLLTDWYRQEAKDVFAERIERYRYILKQEGISVNQLLIRRLEKRWGSCTENGNIVLNLSLVQAPVQCIDYVLIHEMCHLKYLDHGPKFYQLLSRYVEDWEKRKARLRSVSLLQ